MVLKRQEAGTLHDNPTEERHIFNGEPVENGWIKVMADFAKHVYRECEIFAVKDKDKIAELGSAAEIGQEFISEAPVVLVFVVPMWYSLRIQHRKEEDMEKLLEERTSDTATAAIMAQGVASNLGLVSALMYDHNFSDRDTILRVIDHERVEQLKYEDDKSFAAYWNYGPMSHKEAGYDQDRTLLVPVAVIPIGHPAENFHPGSIDKNLLLGRPFEYVEEMKWF
jgi:hypothetical protein